MSKASHVLELDPNLPRSPTLLLPRPLPPLLPLRPPPHRLRPCPRILAHRRLLPHPRLLQLGLAPPLPHTRLGRDRIPQPRLAPQRLLRRPLPAGHSDYPRRPMDL